MTEEERHADHLAKLVRIFGSIAIIGLCVVASLSMWAATRRNFDSGDAIRQGGERATCDARYAQQASAASRKQLSLIGEAIANEGELLKVISTVPASDPASRVEQAAALVKRADEIGGELNTLRPVVDAANNARDAYLVAGRPLPCPLDVSG